MFLGGAESMWHMSDRFQAVRIGGTFVYRVAATARTEPPRRPSRPRATTPARRPPARPVRLSPSPRTAAPEMTVTRRPTTEGVAQRGREALASGDLATAVQAFRQWAYLQPDDALAHLHLGLALDETGDRRAANRAYQRSRQVLVTDPSTETVGALEGFGLDEVVRLLDAKRARA